MSRSVKQDYEDLRARQARAQESIVRAPEHGIGVITTYSATCLCGHVERSTIRFAALDLYLMDHINEEADK